MIVNERINMRSVTYFSASYISASASGFYLRGIAEIYTLESSSSSNVAVLNGYNLVERGI